MLTYTDKISIVKKLIKTSNIGLGKFTIVKINTELDYNLIRNT